MGCVRVSVILGALCFTRRNEPGHEREREELGWTSGGREVKFGSGLNYLV